MPQEARSLVADDSPVATFGAGSHGNAVGPRRDIDIDTAQSGSCHLANLFLHAPADASGSARPIDVVAVDEASRRYRATLDYAMEGFDLEGIAVPRAICRLSRMMQTTMLVDPGSRVVAVVDVGKTDEEDQVASYSVDVNRLQGFETNLMALHMDGAQLSPSWSPDQTSYSVLLETKQDIVRLGFLRCDEGQAVTLSSAPEQPLLTAAGVTGSTGSNLIWTDFPTIATAPMGEVQHQISTLLTTVDVGYERVVNLTVRSADQSKIGIYKLTVRRPACPVERRFFDGDTGACTDICNEGFFGNPSTGRCSECIEDNCAVCADGLHCTACLDGLQFHHGHCVNKDDPGLPSIDEAETVAMNFGQRHLAMLASVASVAVAGLLLAQCSRRRGRRSPSHRLLDEFDDDDDSAYGDESYRS